MFVVELTEADWSEQFPNEPPIDSRRRSSAQEVDVAEPEVK